MESGLLILLMFAGLGLSSNAATPRNWYGLSASQSAVLDKNVANFDAAAIAYRDAFKSLFEVFYDTEAKSGNDRSSKVSGAILRMKDGVYLSYDSLRTTTKTSSTAVDAARRASYQHLKNVALQVSSAVKLVQSANGLINQDAFEVHRTAAQESFKKLAQQFYSLIATSLNTKNAEVLAVIQNSLDKSSLSLVHMNNAIFNAIKVWAAAPTADGYADRLFRSTMEDLEDKALYGIREDDQCKFSTLSTFYIYTQLNMNGILSMLAANQNALFGSYRRSLNGNDIIFNAVVRSLQRIQLGLSDDGNLDLSQDNVERDAVRHHYNAGDSLNLDYISLIHANSSSTIATAREQIFSVNREGAQSFYDILEIAGTPGSNYSEVMNTIEVVRTVLSTQGETLAGNYYNAIQGTVSYRPELETESTTRTQNIAKVEMSAVDLFLDSVIIVANATYEGNVSEDDYARNEANGKKANGFFEFTKIISEDSLLVSDPRLLDRQSSVKESTSPSKCVSSITTNVIRSLLSLVLPRQTVCVD